MARRSWRSPSIPAYREKSIGSPKRTPIRMTLGMILPVGWALSVPIMATGMTGTPASRASRATPVLPR